MAQYQNINNILFAYCISIFVFIYYVVIDQYGSAYAQVNPDFIATLSGRKKCPPVKTTGTGELILSYLIILYTIKSTYQMQGR